MGTAKRCIPPLEHGCGSWVVTRDSTGEVIGEFFREETLWLFDPAAVTIETSMQYLQRINAASQGATKS